MAGRPSCGPEFALAAKPGGGDGGNPRACAVRREDTGGPAAKRAAQGPGCGHLLQAACARGIRALAG
eukprot:12725077-Alexandrium_andersonii.AAC.1